MEDAIGLVIVGMFQDFVDCQGIKYYGFRNIISQRETRYQMVGPRSEYALLTSLLTQL